MSKGPLQRLTDEEIEYLKAHLYREVRDAPELYRIFGQNHEVMKWLERKILITADHFKLRYSKQDE